jgi:membrane-bound serine protease (ClpP class)
MLLIALLYIAGIILILAEFLLPGLILGIIGGLLLIASGALVFYHDPQYGWFIVLGQVLGLGLAILVGIWMLSKSGMSKGLTLNLNQEEAAGYTNQLSNRALIGLSGTVLTALRPAGTIEVGEERIDAVSNGLFIDQGDTVRIIEVHGNRVVVERPEEQA